MCCVTFPAATLRTRGTNVFSVVPGQQWIAARRVRRTHAAARPSTRHDLYRPYLHCVYRSTTVSSLHVLLRWCWRLLREDALTVHFTTRTITRR
jgi:hypothetical protein